MDKELQAFAKEIAESIKISVANSISETMKKYEERLAALEDNGHAREEIEAFALQAINKAITALPVPEKGEKGDAGERGLPGHSVTMDELAIHIEKMIDERIQKLPKAIDGKDAAQIEIEPILQEKESYPRGTYALHKGGLWRAFENTKGMHGWECILDGIHKLSINSISERDFCLIAEKSSSDITKLDISIPVMIYRGLYNEDAEYTEGDTVTYAGSMWYCKTTTKNLPSENSKEWVICVRKGRDQKVKL